MLQASPKVYRGEWHAPLSTIYKACCEIAPAPVSRPRGAIRYSLLSRGEFQQRISQHAQAAEGSAVSIPAADIADHIISTHAIIK